MFFLFNAITDQVFEEAVVVSSGTTIRKRTGLASFRNGDAAIEEIS